MVKKNVSLNIGYCQGVMNAGVFSPSPSYARMDVRTKNVRKNPVTKRYDMQVFNFVALGDMVEQIVHGCKVGDRVTVSYYLKERVHINKRTGKGAFVNEMIIKDIFVRSAADEGKVGSVNFGFLQGKFIGVVKVPHAEGIYNLSVLYDSDLKYGPQHFDFVVYGPLGEKLMSAYEKGQYVNVQYKVEKVRHIRNDGKPEFFTNFVVEKIE